MVSWIRRMIGGRLGKGGETHGAHATTPGSESLAKRQLVDSLDDLIKTPGKACYRTLVALATTCSKEEFVSTVHCPAFVGAGIRDGELEKVLASSVSGKSNKTQMFNPSVRAALIEGASLEQSIFLLRKPVSSSIRDLRTFTVGRTQQNDILMNDFAISREHAVVELRGDRYYLKDLGSSNGTYVGGKLIDDRGTLLQDGHAVRFARYEFNFLSVGALFELLKKRSVAAIDAAL